VTRKPSASSNAAPKPAGETAQTTTTSNTTTSTTTTPAAAPSGGNPPPASALPSLPGRQKPKGFFSRLLGAIGPNNADSIPLPLIFLAGLALVLTAAGAAGMITRHVQARRAGSGPPPPTDPPPAP
jgi:hypothetical protein